jgi:hypothetical protein
LNRDEARGRERERKEGGEEEEGRSESCSAAVELG